MVHVILKSTLHLQYSSENMVGARHHVAITQRLITLSIPLLLLLLLLTVLSFPNHTSISSLMGSYMHTSTHTFTQSYCPNLPSKLKPLHLPSHTAVRYLAASIAPAISLTNLKLPYGFLQRPRAGFPLLTLPNQSITLNCSISLVKR